MKYIRTKDGKIYDKSKIICYAFREEYISPNWNDDIEKYLQTKIVAEADTIEELCDCLVLWENIYKIRRSTAKAEIDTHAITEGTYKWNEEKYKDAYANTYGAIWTNRGLIYVAKMNDKGELELL